LARHCRDEPQRKNLAPDAESLNSIGQKLTSILDLDDLLVSLLDLSIENVRAERGMVFLQDASTGEMQLASARGMDRETLDGVASFSRSVVKRVAEGHTLLKVDVASDATLSASESGDPRDQVDPVRPDAKSWQDSGRHLPRYAQGGTDVHDKERPL